MRFLSAATRGSPGHFRFHGKAQLYPFPNAEVKRRF